jgi:hypothetical protein
MRSNLRLRRLSAACAAAACTATLLHGQEPAATRFYPDDPIAIDRDTAADASATARDPLGNYADFVLNTFVRVGDKRAIPAVNVNTLGEVPDSSWFTNRLGSRPMSVDEIVRGPDRVHRLDIGDWVIVAGKGEGRQAGFRAVSATDPAGPMYQIEFDPIGNPEMATGAEIIGTAIYHALGYNVVDVYLVEIDTSRLSIAPTATIEVAGVRRAFTARDLDQVLKRAARKADGRLRATASRFADGRNVGPFRYYGTRPDDPNDIYPHEHRRELRGNRVFCAWLNHDDSRAVNTLDMLVESGSGRHVKHYMFDFGSILGSGTNEEDHPWVGHEYVVERRPALLTLASFGLWRRPFIDVEAPSHLPAAGNFTADGFRPAAWKPHYPNAAFRNAQPEDLFWAARLVAAFTPEAVGRIVEKAQFSDPAVADHVTGALLRRRALILREWLTHVNPIANPRVDRAGVLQFANAAVDAGLAAPPLRYELSWFQFDNGSGRRTYVGGESRTAAGGVMPLARLNGAYAGVDIRTVHPEYPGWRAPVRLYFRRSVEGWTPVGLERRPDIQTERYARR